MADTTVWEVIENRDGQRVDIGAHHGVSKYDDVWLQVTGNFEDHDAKVACAHELCDQLNNGRLDAPTMLKLTARIAKLETALKQLAQYGTHHDTEPTRPVYPLDHRAVKVDAWWKNYFKGADRRVCHIAQDALTP